MSAPVKERPRAAAGGTAVLDAPARPTRAATIPTQRGAGAGKAAAGRAYARRDERLRRLTGRPSKAEPRTAGRAQFVLLVMVLLVAGLVATLWLSTAAAADSYQLQSARDAAQKLTEQSEQLHREVAAMESAPALAQRATALGMIPVTDAARLVVGADGSVTVVGTPKAVSAPVVVAPAPAGPSAPVTTADGQAAADPAAGAAPAGAAAPAAGTGAAAAAAGGAVPGAGTAAAAGATAAGGAAPAAGAAVTGGAAPTAGASGAGTASGNAAGQQGGTAAGAGGAATVPNAVRTGTGGTNAAATGGAGAATPARTGQQPAAGTH